MDKEAKSQSESKLRASSIIFLMLFSSLAAGLPSASATTGYEAVSLNNVTNSSVNVSSIYLDNTDTYSWSVDIVNSSGTTLYTYSGSISGVSSHVASPAWTTPTVAGTYFIEAELSVMGIIAPIVLDNASSSFVISAPTNGTGNGTLTEKATLSSVTTTSATLGITNLNSSDTYYWWTFVYRPNGSTNILWYSSGYRMISGITSGTYYPNWTDPVALGGPNGTYTVVGEIRNSFQQVLDSDTDYFSIGGSGSGNGSSNNGSNNSTPTTHDVYISNFAFVQNNITVQTGDSVRWTNNDSYPHTVTSSSSSGFNSGMISMSNTWTHIFNNTGTYNYFCSYHSTMSGVVYVQSSSSNNSSGGQNDAGSGGDVGNSSNTSYSLSPGSHSQYTGYVHSTNDYADVYSVYVPTGYGLAAELSFTASNDYDLYLIDSNWTYYVDQSAGTSNPESVTTNGTNVSGGGYTFYIAVTAYNGSGNYSLDIWLFTSTTFTQNDANLGGDAGDNATNAYTLNPGSYSQYTGYVHSSSDVYDAYEIYLYSGYDLNASVSFGTTNDYDLYLTDSAFTTPFDYSWNSNPESVTTNNTNLSGSGQYVYLLVEAYAGSGNYTLDIWMFANNSNFPSVSVTMPNKDSANNHYTGLTVGTSYAFNYTIFEGPVGSNSSSNYSANFSYTATSTSIWDNITFQTTDSEGSYGIITYLYQNGTLVALDWDIVYHEMLENSVTSDTSGNIYSSNLTVGDSYSIMWSTGEYAGGSGNNGSNGTGSPTNTPLGNGTYNFTATSSSMNYPVYWSSPISYTQHDFDVLLYNSTGDLIGIHSYEFYPTPPSIEIGGLTSNANSTTNSVDTFAYDLAVGETYSRSIRIESSSSAGNSTIAYSGLISFNASATNMSFVTFNYNTPNSTGIYCAHTDLYSGSGTHLSSDYSCFQLTFDADGDGVIDGNDLCPNTPLGATVDANGCSASQRDTDGDGYMDNVDAFVNDSTQWSDADGDGYGDNANGNNPDAFPTDSTQWSDSDGDGYGDNANGNNPDAFPFDPTQWADSDSDGYGDNPQGTNPDAFPSDGTQWSDVDGDGCGDNSWGNFPDFFPNDVTQCGDADGDGYGDNASGNNPDAFPQDPTQWTDADGDGYGDNADGNNPDAFPTDSTQWSDADGDGYGDNPTGTMPDAFPADSTQWSDADGDGYGDNANGNNPDAFPTDSTQWSDADGDGVGDNTNGNNGDHCLGTPLGEVVDEFGCSDSQIDDDLDYVMNDEDACPNTGPGVSVNSVGCAQNQLDDDGDLVNNTWDNCPNTPLGSTVDLTGCADSQKDDDDDGVTDDRDNCSNTASGMTVDAVGCAENQIDSDEDGIWDSDDICDYTPHSETPDSMGCSGSQKDTDSDYVTDDIDQCSRTEIGASVDVNGCSEAQRDTDLDGAKDNIDNCANTPIGIQVDSFGCEVDEDGDGIGDSSDTCRSTTPGKIVDVSGCADYQKDSDIDNVNDEMDNCPNTLNGSIVDTNGCADYQKDSDGDGTRDDQDAFPEDSNFDTDSDGDGVDDSVDAYPTDSMRSSVEESNNMMWIMIAGIIVAVTGGVLFFVLGRKDEVSSSVDSNFDPSTEAMFGDSSIEQMSMIGATIETESKENLGNDDFAVAQQTQQQWQDANGIHWTRHNDGSMMWFDANSGEWITFQQ